MAAGLAISIYGLGALIAAPLAGYLCDRVGPHFLLKLGLLLQGLILLMFPLVDDFKPVLLMTLAWSLAGEVFRPASSTLIASVVDEKLRRVAFALNRVAVNVGMSIGPALGGVLIHTRPSYIFLANGGTSILAGALLTYCFRGKDFAPFPITHREVEQRPNSQGNLGVGSLFLFLLALIPAFVVFYQYRSTLTQYLVGHQILKPYVFGLLLPINALMVLVLQVPLTLYLQKCRERLSMSLGAFLIGAGFGCFVFPTTYLGAAFCVVVWTVGQMILLSGSEIYVSKIAGAKRGQYMGFYQMAINFAAFVGPGLGSILLGQSVALLWVTMFTLGSLSAVILLQVIKQTDVANTSVKVPVRSYAGVALPFVTR